MQNRPHNRRGPVYTKYSNRDSWSSGDVWRQRISRHCVDTVRPGRICWNMDIWKLRYACMNALADQNIVHIDKKNNGSLLTNNNIVTR